MGDDNADNSRAERLARRAIRTVEKKKVEVRKVRRWIKKLCPTPNPKFFTHKWVQAPEDPTDSREPSAPPPPKRLKYLPVALAEKVSLGYLMPVGGFMRPTDSAAALGGSQSAGNLAEPRRSLRGMGSQAEMTGGQGEVADGAEGEEEGGQDDEAGGGEDSQMAE